MWSVKELLILVEAADQYNGDWSTVSDSLQKHALLSPKAANYTPQNCKQQFDNLFTGFFESLDKAKEVLKARREGELLAEISRYDEAIRVRCDPDSAAIPVTHPSLQQASQPLARRAELKAVLPAIEALFVHRAQTGERPLADKKPSLKCFTAKEYEKEIAARTTVINVQATPDDDRREKRSERGPGRPKREQSRGERVDRDVKPETPKRGRPRKDAEKSANNNTNNNSAPHTKQSRQAMTNPHLFQQQQHAYYYQPGGQMHSPYGSHVPSQYAQQYAGPGGNLKITFGAQNIPVRGQQQPPQMGGARGGNVPQQPMPGYYPGMGHYSQYPMSPMQYQQMYQHYTQQQQQQQQMRPMQQYAGQPMPQGSAHPPMQNPSQPQQSMPTPQAGQQYPPQSLPMQAQYPPQQLGARPMAPQSLPFTTANSTTGHNMTNNNTNSHNAYPVPNTNNNTNSNGSGPINPIQQVPDMKTNQMPHNPFQPMPMNYPPANYPQMPYTTSGYSPAANSDKLQYNLKQFQSMTGRGKQAGNKKRKHDSSDDDDGSEDFCDDGDDAIDLDAPSEAPSREKRASRSRSASATIAIRQALKGSDSSDDYTGTTPVKKEAKPAVVRTPRGATPKTPRTPKALARVDDPAQRTKMLLDLTNVIAKHSAADVFHEPVTREEAPDYFEHIKHPMDIATMRAKIKAREINDIDEWVRNMTLIFENCKAFNQPETEYYICAVTVADFMTKHLQKNKDLYVKLAALHTIKEESHEPPEAMEGFDGI